MKCWCLPGDVLQFTNPSAKSHNWQWKIRKNSSPGVSTKNIPIHSGFLVAVFDHPRVS
jgi:hypothetical protein